MLWLTSHTGELTGTILVKFPGPKVLPGALNTRRIEPKDTIESFAFLEAPEGGFTGDMRLRIRHANDVEEVQPVSPPVADTSLLAETPMASMTEMYKWTESVSGLEVIRYSEE